MKDKAAFNSLELTAKGHFKIELFNAKTRERENCVEFDNHVNTGLLQMRQREAFYHGFNACNNRTMSSLQCEPAHLQGIVGSQSYVLNSLVLFNQDTDDVTESSHAPCWPYTPSGDHFIAMCFMNSTALWSSYSGLFNITDTYNSPSELKMIFDWTTEKGNGTFNSIALFCASSYDTDAAYFIFTDNQTPNATPCSYRVPGKFVTVGVDDGTKAYASTLACSFLSPDLSCHYRTATQKIEKLTTDSVLSDWFSSSEIAAGSRDQLEIDQYSATEYDIAYISGDNTIKVFNKAGAVDTYVGTITPSIYAGAYIYTIFIYDRILTTVCRTADNVISIIQYALDTYTGSPATSNNIAITRDRTDGGDKWSYIPTDDPDVAYLYSTTVSSVSSCKWSNNVQRALEFEVTLSSGLITAIGSQRNTKYALYNYNTGGITTRHFVHSYAPTVKITCVPVLYERKVAFSIAETNNFVYVRHDVPVTSSRNLAYNTAAICSQTFTPVTKTDTQTMKITYTITLSEA